MTVAVSPAITAWLQANAQTNSFAYSLQRQLVQRGNLSDKQIAAVENAIVRHAQQLERAQNAPVVNIKEIEDRFEYAKNKGVARPMLRLGVYKFKPASPNGNNAGAIWVTEAESDGRYLGKIKDGKFFASRDCDAETEAAVLEVAANPAEAAKAYGRRTGNCCVCGRTLTVDESIDRMIGPICAARYGF